MDDPDSRSKPAAVTRAVECIFPSPGFLLHFFSHLKLPSLPNNTPSAFPTNMALSTSPVVQQQEKRQKYNSGAANNAATDLERVHLSSQASISGHGLDVGAINRIYERLLKMYKSEVIAALGASCLRLVEGGNHCAVLCYDG